MLAISLHAVRDELRDELVPINKRYPLEALMAACADYLAAKGRRLSFEWALIDGVNDTPEELDGIVRLLAGKYAIMNMIPYNAVPDLPFRRPAWDKAADIARQLHRRGILTKLRNSAGQDVEGGCGQLWARVLGDEARPAEVPVKFVRGS